jgi:hypothetical protein
MGFFIYTPINKNHRRSCNLWLDNLWRTGETLYPLEMKHQLPVGSDIARRLLRCNSILRFGVQREERLSHGYFGRNLDQSLGLLQVLGNVKDNTCSIQLSRQHWKISSFLLLLLLSWLGNTIGIRQHIPKADLRSFSLWFSRSNRMRMVQNRS